MSFEDLDVVGDPISEREWSELASRLDVPFTDRPTYTVASSTLPLGGRGLPVAKTAVAGIADDHGVGAVLGLRLLGIGPLRVASMSGHRLGCAADAVVDGPESARALADLLRRKRFALKFDQIPTRSLFLDALRNDSGWYVDEEIVAVSPVMTLHEGETARDMRSARSLKRLRTARRALERAHGPVEFVTVTTPDELAARLPDIRRVSAARSASIAERFDYFAPPLAHLIETTLADEARAGRLVITGMLVNGTWMAHEISLLSGRTLHSWLSHFDPTFAAAQPGHQILVELADTHEAIGFEHLDHGANITGIKKAWSGPDTYQLSRVVAVPAPARIGRLLAPALRASDRLRESRNRLGKFRAGRRASAQSSQPHQSSAGSGSDTTTMPSSSE